MTRAPASCFSGCQRSQSSISPTFGPQRRLTFCRSCIYSPRSTWTLTRMSVGITRGSFAGALLAALLRCSSLIELILTCGFNSTHWSTLFAKLTKLEKLTIRRGAIESLQSLEELAIQHTNLPPSELSHLYALRRLRALRLDGCFSNDPDDATLASLSPPTSILPALTELFHPCLSSWWDRRARQGPSFEWMQSRMVQ